MDITQQEPKNPLGLSLDFMFGRGYLWAQRQRLNDWIALESLRMEIPDLQFPFDARGGLQRFRHTRCLVREVEFAISEVGLGDLLTEAASHLEGFEELQIRFLEDAAHVSLKLKSFGADTYLSFRAALVPPEPARADEVHLSFYDYRAYGPLPYPARLVVHELLTSLLNTPVLRASGRGASFTVGIAGDIISFRPLKLLFLHLFPRVGWKLPNLSGVVLDSARIRPGVMTIRAVDDDPQSAHRRAAADHELATSREGGRALAAYEAKELFAHADQALFEGQMRQALSLLASYRDVYGLHPALVARLLDCLLADPSPANIAEAEAIRRELTADDPDDLLAALAAPIIARARHRHEEGKEAFEKLSAELERRRQTRDWILAELALSDLLVDDEPEAAAERLREVLKRDPRHRAALERLRAIYERLGERAGLEETLKRLTGVYTERQTLKRTYLQLAKHLMDRQGDLAEARMYLEKVLRLDPTELEALHTLGESYVLGGEPLRALKAFGSAARAAEVEGSAAQASRLHYRVGQLWYSELEDPRQALLEYRRALTLSADLSLTGSLSGGLDDEAQGLDEMERVAQLRQAAQMCEELSRDDEALNYWRETLPILERRLERAPGDFDSPMDGAERERASTEEEILVVHRRLGGIYDRRNRPAAAATHIRRILELAPDDEEALLWLENHLRQAGRPEELIGLYDDLLAGARGQSAKVELLEKLGDLYGQMGMAEEAQGRYRQILDVDPGHCRVRRKLVKLLTDHRRFGALRDALNTVMVRTTERAIRHEISMELGRANEAMGDLERAARSYLEAVKLEAGNREALESASRVVEVLVETQGVDAEAPSGTEPVGKLLEKLLIRLAEITPSLVQQREVLLKVALIADERGDLAAAAEARERAQSLSGEVGKDGEFSGVDDRLDAMLDSISGVERGDRDRDGSSSDQERSSDGVRDIRPTPKKGMKAVELPTENIDEPKPEEKLTSFRRRFASMIKEPAELPRVSKDDDEEGDSSSRLRSLLNRARRRENGERDHGVDEQGQNKPNDFREQPGTVRLSAEEFAKLRDGSRASEKVSPPAEAAKSESAKSKKPKPTGWSFNLSEPPGLGEESSEPRGLDGESVGLNEESEIDTSPRINPAQMALEALKQARQSGGPAEVASAIEDVLTVTDNGASPLIDNEHALALSREVAELHYYDLEDGEAALPHLERVRRLDPQGLGAETAVVNALEAIYEERGNADGRIALLEQRLESAETAEMATTYRLLLAQLLWDQRDDADGARERLDEVLKGDGDHEAAHRLLGEIASEAGDWKTAARHLEVVVRVAGGGIDAVETQRELAELYLHQLDDPQRALSHYEAVLSEAPGDSQALEGIKECQASQNDWAGYVSSLGRELGLLVGNREGLDAEAMANLEVDKIAAALRVPASQIVADAAHIVEEEMERPEEARHLWGVTYRLWPEHVEALQRRVELDRRCDEQEALAEDLEAYAAMILDAGDRFAVLVEAAQVRAEKLDDPKGATTLYAEAIALVQDAEEPPKGLDAARRALKRLQADGEW